MSNVFSKTPAQIMKKEVRYPDYGKLDETLSRVAQKIDEIPEWNYQRRARMLKAYRLLCGLWREMSDAAGIV